MLSLRSKITQAVLRYFLLHKDTEGHVNELARRLLLDSGNLTRKLIELENNGILKSRWQGAQRLYSLNSAFPLLKEYKKIIKQTIGLEHILRGAFKNVPGIKKAIIFGSYADDKMDPKSDIDVLVVGDHSAIDLQRKIAAIQKSMDREINVVSMTPGEYRKQAGEPLLCSIRRKKNIVLI